jgi:nucleoside-diphosphate kinase
MKSSYTLAVIKPLAVQKKYTGDIIQIIENAGFSISALKMIQLTKTQAQDFYAIHKYQTFFESLTDFMSSAPVIVMVLSKTNAVQDFRKLIGCTNPLDADDNTIRKKFGTSLQKNAVHGSDSDRNAIAECQFFFAEHEIFFP